MRVAGHVPNRVVRPLAFFGCEVAARREHRGRPRAPRLRGRRDLEVPLSLRRGFHRRLVFRSFAFQPCRILGRDAFGVRLLFGHPRGEDPVGEGPLGGDEALASRVVEDVGVGGHRVIRVRVRLELGE